jgi:hypothetical protein
MWILRKTALNLHALYGIPVSKFFFYFTQVLLLLLDNNPEAILQRTANTSSLSVCGLENCIVKSAASRHTYKSIPYR